MFRRIAQLGVLSGVVALLAYVQNRMMVQYLGAGATVDAYYLGLTLPMATVAVMGVASVTLLVPVFARRKRDEGVVGGAGLGLLTAGLLVGLMLVQAPLSVALGFWSLADDGWTWLALLTLGAALYGFSYYGQVLAVAVERTDWFVWSQIANAVTFVGLLASGVVTDVTSLALAFAIGAFVQALTVTIPLVRTHALDLRDLSVPDGLGTLMRRSLPACLLGTAFMQGSIAVDRWFANSLGEGVVTTYYIADRVIQMVLALVSTAIGHVVFARMAASETRVASSIAGKTVRGLVVLLAPLTSVVWVYAPGIVRFLFEGGRFDEAAVTLTGVFLKVLALGLLPMAVVYVMPRRLHAENDFRTFAIVAAGLLAGDWVLKFVLTPRLGAEGLAPASVGAYIVCALGYLVILWRRRLIILEPRAARDIGIALLLGAVHAAAVTAIPNAASAVWAAPVSLLGLWLIAAAAGGALERKSLRVATQWLRRA